MEFSILADAPPPTLDLSYVLALVSRVAHTTIAATLFGGIVYLRCLVAPVVAGADDNDEATFRGQRATWARIAGLAAGVQLISGFYNFYDLLANYEKVAGSYHMLFGLKILLAVFVLFVAAAIGGKTPLATGMRANMKSWLNMCLAALVAIFVLGAAMKSYPKIPAGYQAVPVEQAESDG